MRLGLAAFGFLLAVTPAAAQSCANIIDGTDPSKIFSIVKGYGSAEIGTDNQGDPKISGRMNGIRYTIYFYGCRNGENCTNVQFRAGFSQQTKPSLQKINQWNSSKRFGKALLDKDGDAAVEMNVNLRGGVCGANFDETMSWWQTVLRQFVEHINFR